MGESVKDRALRWLLHGKVGVSSRTICAVMLGEASEDSCSLRNVPHDSGDFIRCYKLLELIPEWRDEMHKIAEAYPFWKPFVDHWEEITALYEAGKDDEVYRLIDRLDEESRALAYPDCAVNWGRCPRSMGVIM